MPISLDTSLPPSLYPLAWLIGSWEGSGALSAAADPAADGSRPAAPRTGAPDRAPAGSGGDVDDASSAAPADVRVEQQLVCTAQEDGTLAWRSTIHRVDAPAPLPPTSAFARDDAPAPARTGSGARTLLHREDGVWTVGDLLPGQDPVLAAAAPPGSPQSVLSYRLDARMTLRTEIGGGSEESHWAGEVRGPRIQLALAAESGEISDTLMLGYISGRLMWLWERRLPVASGAAEETALSPFLSMEMHRV